MHTVASLTAEIIKREGGYVNDPDDPGGATNYGVTIHTMRRLGVDMDGDGDVDVRDVKLLTADKAAEIYQRHYFFGPRIDQLPKPLQATVYDMYVNAGGNAVKILQRLCNQIDGTGSAISADGAIGPRTLQKVAACYQKLGDYMADAYGIARRNYYYAIGDGRPASRKYARRRDGGKGGWIRRAEEFISPKYHLSDQQHRTRVAAWG